MPGPTGVIKAAGYFPRCCLGLCLIDCCRYGGGGAARRIRTERADMVRMAAATFVEWGVGQPCLPPIAKQGTPSWLNLKTAGKPRPLVRWLIAELRQFVIEQFRPGVLDKAGRWV